MTTLLYTHEACLEHDPGSYHPESPDRLRAVLAGLGREEFAGLERREAPRAELDEVARVHPRAFIEEVLGAVPQRGHAALDADTVLSPRSGEAALRAVGAVAPPSTPWSTARATTPSAPCARPATTPRRIAPWASASSTASPSAPSARARSTGWSALR